MRRLPYLVSLLLVFCTSGAAHADAPGLIYPGGLLSTSPPGCVEFDPTSVPFTFHSTGIPCNEFNSMPSLTCAGLGALANPEPGTLYYCTDCQESDPCTCIPAGTGAFALRIDGRWSCSAGAQTKNGKAKQWAFTLFSDTGEIITQTNLNPLYSILPNYATISTVSAVCCEADAAGTTINFYKNSGGDALLVTDFECGVNEMLCSSDFNTGVADIDFEDILDFFLTANTDSTRINVVLPYLAEVDGPPHPISGHYIQDEGQTLAEQPYLNFVGAGVTVTDDPGNNASKVTILDLSCSTGEVVSCSSGSCTCVAGSAAFSALTTGTNTQAAMVVGSGASLATTGTGTIGATSLTCTDCLSDTQIQDLYVSNGVFGDTMLGALTLRSPSLMNSSPELNFVPWAGNGVAWNIGASTDGLRFYTFNEADNVTFEAEDADPPQQVVNLRVDGSITSYFGNLVASTGDITANSGTVAGDVLSDTTETRSHGYIAVGDTPTIISCGTNPSITGTRSAGKIVVGTGSTTACSIQFETAFSYSSTVCVVTSSTHTAVLAITSGNTGFTVTSSGALDGQTVNYICMGI